ncbi:MAG: hypothetical protein NC911_09005 [Candidatus Omnitrophica bacterium]|nr:hypothetical protein [Candidatus Omnitrophota bacterium]MCM8769782.1 hypothetical protein [Candidatus Omnitrophota bacterium]
MGMGLPKKIRWVIIGMLVSYGLIWFAFHCIFFCHNDQKIGSLKEIKEQLEYDYLLLKGSPRFVGKVSGTVEQAREKIKEYTWLIEAPDPGLAAFEYLSDIIKRNRLSLQEMKGIETSDEQAARYFIWEISVEGQYQNLVNAVREIETGRRYLRITRVEIVPSDTVVYYLTISGLKKLG